MKSAFPFKTFILLWISHVYLDFCIGIWPIYKTLAGIDIAMAGLIMGVAGFSGEILQLAFGYLSDIGHRKKILILGMLLAGAVFFITFSKGFTSLLALMFCLMIGSGSYHPAGAGIASGLFPQKGRAILMFTSGGALGLGISQLVFCRCLERFNGHVYPLLIPMLIIVGFWIYHRLPQELPERKTPSLRDFFAPFAMHKRSLILLYICQVMGYGVLLSFIFLLPDILKTKGSSPWLFMGGGHMSFIFGSMIGMVILSYLCVRLGYKQMLFGSTLIAIVLLYAFLILPLPPTGMAIGLLGLLGASLYLMNPLIIAWGNHLIPQNPSTVSALLMGLAWCFSNLLPTLSGFLASQFSYILALSLVALFLLPSLLCIALMPSPEKILV